MLKRKKELDSRKAFQVGVEELLGISLLEKQKVFGKGLSCLLKERIALVLVEKKNRKL